MTFALNRSLHIQYNTGNNLPRRIIHPQGSIVNHYTLGGAKLGKMLFDRYDNLTYHEQYYGDLVIKDGQPTRILHGDGTISINGSSVEYHYHLKDHLGNVRMVIKPDANNTPVVLQANDYYPFGMVYNMNFQSGGGAHQPNKYLYNSKEEQEMPGKWLDYGARFYDAQLGRWHVPDPMSEIARRWTTYQYAYNNPIRFIDPDGMVVDDYFNKDGKYLGSDAAETSYVKIIDQKTWNENKVVAEDGTESIDHEIGKDNSELHSESNITEESSLKVYDHYNPTDLPLRNDEESSNKWGMSFSVDKVDGKLQKSIKIKMKGNKEQKISDRASEIRNLFSHESKHNSDFDKFGVKSYIAAGKNRREQRAVNAQMKHSSWSDPNTREGFRKLMKSYGAKHGMIFPIQPISPKLEVK